MHDIEAGPRVDGPTEQRRYHTGRWRRLLLRDELGVIVVLVGLVGIVGVVHPPFLNTPNLLSTAQSSSYVGLMACGMVFPLAMREVDLSVGGNYALGIVVGAELMLHGVNPWLAALLLIAVCTVLGGLNGAITTLIDVPSFIVTLASALLFRGAALALADGKQIAGLPADSSFFVKAGGSVAGMPAAVWMLIAITLLLAVVFTRTRFGAQVRAVGSNPEAAVYSGIPVGRTRILALATSGLTAGVAAALALAFFIAGDPTIGQGYELTAIAACIIGGTPLIGGRGSVLGAATGSLILAVVATSLVFFHVPINWTTFATGAVILLAVALDAQLRRSRGRSLLRSRARAPLANDGTAMEKT
jgi:ribose/xylose/arabinose/galactoside ABC-type transport system permease subunit